MSHCDSLGLHLEERLVCEHGARLARRIRSAGRVAMVANGCEQRLLLAM